MSKHLSRPLWLTRNSVQPEPDVKSKTLVASPQSARVSSAGHKKRPRALSTSTAYSNRTRASSSVKHLIPSISAFHFPTEDMPPTPRSPLPSETLITTNNLGIQGNVGSASPVFDCGEDHTEERKLGFSNVSLDENEHDETIQPVVLLVQRIEAWHVLLKNMHHYFGVLARAEHQVAKAYQRLNDHTMFTSADAGEEADQDAELLRVHFPKEDGIRLPCHAWQAYHSNATQDHADLATYLTLQALPLLGNMKEEIKDMLHSIKDDDRLCLTTLAKLRREAKRKVLQLDNQLAYFEQYPHLGFRKLDPWIVNAEVIEKVLRVYRHANKMHETVLRLQQEVLISEQRIIQGFRQICLDITHSFKDTALALDAIEKAINDMRKDGDWLHFVENFKRELISQDAPFRHPSRLHYTHHDHPLLQPVFASKMERNSSVLHRWHEYMYVLTPAGFLHEYRSSKRYPSHPDCTLFVPHFNVTTLSTNLHQNLMFQLQPHSDRQPKSETSFQRSSTTLHSLWCSDKPVSSSGVHQTTKKTWTFRAKSSDDMQIWVEKFTEFSHGYRPWVNYEVQAHRQSSNATKPDIHVALHEPSSEPGVETSGSAGKEDTRAKEEDKEHLVVADDGAQLKKRDEGPEPLPNSVLASCMATLPKSSSKKDDQGLKR